MSLTPEQISRGIEIITSLNSVFAINSGGCLYAAYGTYLKLKQEGVESDEIVIVQKASPYYHTADHYLKQNAAFLQGESSVADSGYHFVISFDGGKTLYDSEGRHPTGEGDLVIPNEKLDTFCPNSLRNGGWNWMFDRNDDLETVNEILNLELVDYY